MQANLANHQATAQLTSSAVNTAIKANARVALTGDYPADATLDTQGIPLGPLLAVYAPDQSANITGQTELHATLHGPLKNKQQLEAHVTIPMLKLAYGDTIQLAATAPIHVDYKDGTINVQRSSIRGTDTDLQFQGTIPTTGNAPMSLLLWEALIFISRNCSILTCAHPVNSSSTSIRTERLTVRTLPEQSTSWMRQ